MRQSNSFFQMQTCQQMNHFMAPAVCATCIDQLQPLLLYFIYFICLCYHPYQHLFDFTGVGSHRASNHLMRVSISFICQPKFAPSVPLPVQAFKREQSSICLISFDSAQFDLHSFLIFFKVIQQQFQRFRSEVRLIPKESTK